MPATIIATPGAANANSYLTLVEADAYFDTRLHGASWTAATTDIKNRALIWATRLVDATVRFTGAKTASDQALEWPRTGMLDRDDVAISTTAVPSLLKDIVCEVALTLIGSDRLLDSAASAQGLTSLRAGPVTLAFRDNIPAPRAVADAIYRMFIFSWIWRSIPGPIVV